MYTPRVSAYMQRPGKFSSRKLYDAASEPDKIVGFNLDVPNAIAERLYFQMKIEDLDFTGKHWNAV